MIVRIFGQSLPEPLLFLLWMTITLTASEYDATRISDEHRNRKSSTLKRDETRLSNVPLQSDFPYRYIFPANHPFLTFAQYLTPPGNSGYHNPSYEVYAASNSHQYPVNHQMPELKYVLKSQTTPTFPQNSLQVSPIPYQSPSSPVILLLHAGPPGHASHQGSHASHPGGHANNGPLQTFVLIPADGNQQALNSMAASNPSFANSMPTLQYATSNSFNNVGFPLRSNMLPITQATTSPQVIHPSQFLKTTNNHFQNQLNSPLLQRPMALYLPSGKLYPQKKNSIEPKASSALKKIENSRKLPSSTERSAEKININALRTRS